MLADKAVRAAQYIQSMDDEDLLDLINHVTDPTVYASLRALIMANTKNLGQAKNAAGMVQHASVISTALSFIAADVYKHKIAEQDES